MNPWKLPSNLRVVVSMLRVGVNPGSYLSCVFMTRDGVF